MKVLRKCFSFNTHPYIGLHFMTWKRSKNDDLTISSEMSVDALAKKRLVLPMDSFGGQPL